MKIKNIYREEEIVGLFTDNRRKEFDFTEGMVFHEIYGQNTEESKQALIALLNTVIEDKPGSSDALIKDINIFNPADCFKSENCNLFEFDIRLETDTGTLIDVEMEKQPDKHFTNRCLMNMMYLSKLNNGINKMTTVSFVGGSLFGEADPYHEVFGFRDENTNMEMTDKVNFHLIEIDKVDQNRNVSDMTPLERVSLYFRYANDPDREALLELLIDSGDKAIILAENIFRRLTADDMEYEMLVAREKFEHQYNTDLSEARNEGLRQGEASGRAAERLEMAKAMRSENIDIETIIKISGLTREEIDKL